MRLIIALASLAALLLSGCGGSSMSNAATGGSSTSSSSQTGGGSPSNTTTMTVDAGPSSLSGAAVNIAYVSVKVCAPGSTSNCQTIDNIQVDTGSYGLRLISTAVSTTLGLPAQMSGGSPILQCVEFADGYVWGPVVSADVYIGGEMGQSVPVQIMGGSSYTVPSDCSGNSQGSEEDTVATFGANGIVGLGPFAQDCGDACVSTVQPANYYACSTTTTCQNIAVPLAQQVTNPVAYFPVDNNGVVLQLPSIGSDGAATATGTLVFGIDTESNNALGSATVLDGDTSQGNSSSGYISIAFNGQTYPDSYIDSGSNLTYFNDSSIPSCAQSSVTPGFFCPTSTMNLSATNQGTNGTTSTVAFSVANATNLVNANPSFTAFNNMGAPIAGAPSSFDFGLPFFYGRNVYVAIYQKNTSQGLGPFFAY